MQPYHEENLQISDKIKINEIGFTASKMSDKTIETKISTKNFDSKCKYIILCQLCEKPYATKGLFHKHYAEIHPNSEIVYACLLCGKGIPDYKNFRNHSYRHLVDGRFKCSLCTKSFSQKSYLDSHVHSFHDNQLQCGKCEKLFLTRSGLKAHNREHHSNNQGKYPCQECGKVLQTQNGYNRHIATHKLKHHFMCDLCGIQFTQKANLVVHINDHFNNKKFGCEKCSKGFGSKNKLEEHLLTHSNYRQYRCKICDKSYKTERYMKYHFSQHNAVKSHICTVCNKGFFSAAKLKEHSNIHSKEKPYKCQYCTADFYNFPNWLKHIRRAHKVDHKTGELLQPAGDGKQNSKTKNHKITDDSQTSTIQRKSKEICFNTIEETTILSQSENYLDAHLLEKDISMNLSDFTMNNSNEYLPTNDIPKNVMNYVLNNEKSDNFKSNDIGPLFYVDPNQSTIETDTYKDFSESPKKGELAFYTENYPNQLPEFSMSEVLREQELELSDSYIKEQMNGSEEFLIPEVPDLNLSSPAVYHNYGFPETELVFQHEQGVSVIESSNDCSQALSSPQSDDYLTQSNSMFHSIDLLKSYSAYDKTSMDIDTTFPYQNDHYDLNNDAFNIENNLSTSFSSTSLIIPNIVKSKDVSDLQFNSWNVTENSPITANKPEFKSSEPTCFAIVKNNLSDTFLPQEQSLLCQSNMNIFSDGENNNINNFIIFTPVQDNDNYILVSPSLLNDQRSKNSDKTDDLMNFTFNHPELI